MIRLAGLDTTAATRSFKLRSSSIKRIPIIGPLAPEIATTIILSKLLLYFYHFFHPYDDEKSDLRKKDVRECSQKKNR